MYADYRVILASKDHSSRDRNVVSATVTHSYRKEDSIPHHCANQLLALLAFP